MTARGWELGLLKGLADAGVNALDVDVVIGTSAGAFLGVQLLSCKSLDALYQAALASPPATTVPAAPLPYDEAYFQETRQLWTNASADTVQRRMAVGQRARSAVRVIPTDAQLRITANALGDIHEWPVRDMRVAAVDVDDGLVRFFTSADGIALDYVLAAGTAQPGRVAPLTIDGHSYMDGGVAGTNIDGAAGYRHVVAIAPGAGPKTQLELTALRALGSEVLLIAPDGEAEAARGQDPLDVGRIGPSAIAGYHQASAIAARVRQFLQP